MDGMLHFGGILEFPVAARLINTVKVGRQMKRAEEQRFVDSLEFKRIMLQPPRDIQDGGLFDSEKSHLCFRLKTCKRFY